MKIDQLQILQSIVEHGSLKSAALKLYKTQPALTMAIKKLEQKVGFSLVDRSQYRLKLTNKGMIFYREASIVLSGVNQLESLAKELAIGNEAKFSICYEQFCSTTDFNNLMTKVFEKFPATEFSISGGTRFASLQQVSDGKADLGIGPWFHLFHAAGDFESIPIGKFNIVLLASPKLFDAQNITRSEQLKQYPCLTMQESSFNFDSVNLSYKQGSKLIKMDDIQTLKSFLLAGAGWALISIQNCKAELASGELQQVKLNDLEHDLEIEVRVFRKKGRRPGPVARYIWQCFADLGS